MIDTLKYIIKGFLESEEKDTFLFSLFLILSAIIFFGWLFKEQLFRRDIIRLRPLEKKSDKTQQQLQKELFEKDPKKYIKRRQKKDAADRRERELRRQTTPSAEGRWRWLILAGLLSLSFILIIFLLKLPVPLKDITLNEIIVKIFRFAQTNTPFSTLIVTLISVPVAFILWHFKNQNNLWEIDNNRKEINLKDFQKLSEWATALHFETTDTQPSQNNSTAVFNRTEGKRALQISAVHQLGAFLRGDFGGQFQRPAFEMLKSLWTAEVRRAGDPPNIAQDNNNTFESYFINVRTIMSGPLGRALTVAVWGDHGDHFYQPNLRNILRGTHWEGLNTSLPDLTGKKLILNDLNLEGIYFTAANLQGAQLQLTDLRGANLQGVIFDGTSLIRANLKGADLTRAKLQKANLKGANLQEAQLQGVLQ